MKSIRAAAVGTLVLAVAGGAMLLGATAASAVTPGYEPDANSQGSVAFYNSTGAQVTSGSNLSHLFDYATASTAGRTGTNKATLFFGFPDHTKADSTTWFSSQASNSTNFPATTAPAPVNGFTNPTVTVGATGANLSAQLGTATLDTTTGYANLIQVRVFDSGPGLPIQSHPFWSTDILFNQSANTWRQVYPAAADTTSTVLGAAPSSSSQGTSVTLTATVQGLDLVPAVGNVQFMDGASNIGTPVPVNGSGVATTSTSSLTVGSHSLSAVFTPTDPTAFAPSTGTTTATVTPPVTATATALAVSGGYLTAGSAATLTATVTGPGSTPNGAGTVAFYDNGSSTAIAGTVTQGPTGTFVLNLASGFTAGGHSIVAMFTPTDPTTYGPSQSSAQAFLTQPVQQGACAQPGSVCTDTQNITATVPVGTLVINTPYTSQSPLNLGTLALSADSTVLTGSATFNNIVVTDTRSGNLPWTVQALATALTDGGSHANSTISAENLGLTALGTTSVGAGFTGTVTYTSNPAANGVAPTDPGSLGLGGTTPHTVAAADHGLGTINFHGTLTLIAPSSTEPGVFAGTITFTVG